MTIVKFSSHSIVQLTAHLNLTQYKLSDDFKSKYLIYTQIALKFKFTSDHIERDQNRKEQHSATYRTIYVI
ncbi:hypothetical protein BpHYR1_010918 [Brachionus plicatilis]|uniref:Uncharacterized protein n=1 Tax=Brachionus plicatilis TaxID=10195 RepID=A0A3M7QE50_BRAPC|nr:hypothetical protein BpHYR1_010918 [Brachionus plicatilis]